MNKILIGLLTISIVGNGYLLMKPESIKFISSEPEEVIVKEIETMAVPDESLIDDMKLVAAKLAEAEAEIVRLQSELELHEERIALNSLNKEIRKDTEENLDSDVVKLTDEQMKRYDEKRKAVMELYNKETVDDTWAYHTQDEIRKALNDLGDSDSYSFDELSCKTSVCRLKINPYKDGQAAKNMAIMNASMALAMQPNLDLQMSGAESLEGDNAGVLMYITKAKH